MENPFTSAFPADFLPGIFKVADPFEGARRLVALQYASLEATRESTLQGFELQRLGLEAFRRSLDAAESAWKPLLKNA